MTPQDNSPAAKAGIEAGDVITAVNGTAIKDLRDLARTIGTMEPGSSVKLDVWHKGSTKTSQAWTSASCRTSVRPRRIPASRMRRGDRRHAAPRPQPSPPPAMCKVPGRRGVVVTSVDPDGPAAEPRHPDRRRHPQCRRQGGPRDVGEIRAELKRRQVVRQAQRLAAGQDRRRATRFVAVPLA